MGIFDKLNGPVFLKESSDAAEQLEQLNRLHQNAPGSLKKQIGPPVPGTPSEVVEVVHKRILIYQGFQRIHFQTTRLSVPGTVEEIPEIDLQLKITHYLEHFMIMGLKRIRVSIFYNLQ